MEGCNTIPNAMLALEGTVHDGALFYFMTSIRPAHRYMKGNVEGPECLATFRLTPRDGKVAARQQSVDQVLPLCHPLDLAVVS